MMPPRVLASGPKPCGGKNTSEMRQQIINMSCWEIYELNIGREATNYKTSYARKYNN